MTIDHEKRVSDLEVLTRALSESNRLMTYQVVELGNQMHEVTKTLKEVRDAVMRLEATDAARNYPSQISSLKENIEKIEERVRNLEDSNMKSNANKNLLGWVIHNWHNIAALGLAALVILKYAILK